MPGLYIPSFLEVGVPEKNSLSGFESDNHNLSSKRDEAGTVRMLIQAIGHYDDSYALDQLLLGSPSRVPLRRWSRVDAEH